MMKNHRKRFFILAMKESWVFIVLLIALIAVLILLSIFVSEGSSNFEKNIFSILVSLLCGIIVSLFAAVVNTYNRSVTAENKIIELLTNSIQILEKRCEDSCANGGKKLNLDELKQICNNGLIEYRELCFISKDLLDSNEFRRYSGKYKSMLDYLSQIDESADMCCVCRKLLQKIHCIQSLL